MTFLQTANWMLLVKLLAAIVGASISALSARILGPADLGAFVSALAIVVLTARAMLLGLGQSAQYFGASEIECKSAFSRTLILTAIPILIFGAGLIFILRKSLGHLLLGQSTLSIDLFDSLWFGVPALGVYCVGTLHALGARKVFAYGVLTMIPLLVTLGVLVWGFAADIDGKLCLLRAWQLNYLTSAICGALILARGSNFAPAPLRRSTKQVIRYAMHSYFVSLAAIAVARSAAVVGVWFSDSTAVGIFAVGRTVAEAPMLIYGAVGPLVLSYVVGFASKVERHQFIGRVCRISFVAFSVISLGVAAIAPIVVSIVFGPEYSDSVFVVLVLLPGLVFAAVQRTLENYLYGVGKQLSLSVTHGVTLCILVGAAFFLAPPLGAVGLALAVSIGKLGSLIFTLFLAYRLDQLSPLLLIVPQKIDFLPLLASIQGRLPKRAKPQR